MSEFRRYVKVTFCSKVYDGMSSSVNGPASLKGYPFEVALEGAKTTTGAALADQVRSIDWQARKVKIVDCLSPASLDTVFAKLRPLLF